MSNKMWGGRFASGPGAIMEEINASIDFDKALYRQDIAASKAHADMLAKQGIITADDAKKIAHGLDTILSEITDGKFSFKRALEDIHMNVEGRLGELIGDLRARHVELAREQNAENRDGQRQRHQAALEVDGHLRVVVRLARFRCGVAGAAFGRRRALSCSRHGRGRGREARFEKLLDRVAPADRGGDADKSRDDRADRQRHQRERHRRRRFVRAVPRAMAVSAAMVVAPRRGSGRP